MKNIVITILASFVFAVQTESISYNTNVFPNSPYGVDVSHYQGKITWSEVRQEIDFVFIKATEGESSVDPYFSYNWSQAKRHGIFHSAYHFFYGDVSGIKQAKHFLNIVKYNKSHDSFPLIVDVEKTSDIYRTNKTQYVRNLRAFLHIVHKETGRLPIIYTSNNFWRTFLKGTHGFSEYALWIASYNNIHSSPKIPHIWKTWVFWQFSNKASVPGIKSQIDLNIFNGDDHRLYHFFGYIQ
ncbi:glycoside hydrolase family 25 protein [Piscirickettsia litoralis]|uniref:Lysozyme n=1 Tax=Piscirickettsia litoralis TaxID=1891921 RepID=A0ABX3A1G2_9GAMM|nr:GH25 family lysozyme [Piscirickettsia litoralis]ODN41290.1 hypothetical protein BGC07_17150 [Piscirickettsia litoralis]